MRAGSRASRHGIELLQHRTAAARPSRAPARTRQASAARTPKTPMVDASPDTERVASALPSDSTRAHQRASALHNWSGPSTPSSTHAAARGTCRANSSTAVTPSHRAPRTWRASRAGPGPGSGSAQTASAFATTSAAAAPAHPPASGALSATRRAHASCSASRTDAGSAAPGSPHAEAASTRRTSSGEPACATRGHAVAVAPSE